MAKVLWRRCQSWHRTWLTSCATRFAARTLGLRSGVFPGLPGSSQSIWVFRGKTRWRGRKTGSPCSVRWPNLDLPLHTYDLKSMICDNKDYSTGLSHLEDQPTPGAYPTLQTQCIVMPQGARVVIQQPPSIIVIRYEICLPATRSCSCLVWTLKGPAQALATASSPGILSP